MRSINSTHSSAKIAPQHNVECLSEDAFFESLQEGEEMDDLRGRIERCCTFRDSYNDQE